MKNYAMTVQYDGTRYNGWQRQGNTPNTIQGKLEDILGKLCGHRVEIHGSGRTDKGAHALGQTASFRIETGLDDTELARYMNNYLPEDIAVVALAEADERFHSRLCAMSKTYIYRIWNSSVPNVFERKYMYTVPEEIDLDKMNRAAECFSGTHDFRPFSSVKGHKKSTVRTIYYIGAERLGNEIRITVKGNGFLYNMVRIISGTLLEVGLGMRNPESVADVFERADRSAAGATLPAKGLTLLKVDYDEG